MGWKNLKEHYDIKHLVQVTTAGICIGSAYVHDLMVIDKDLNIRMPHEYLGKGEPFDTYMTRLKADMSKLRELIEKPDTFAVSIPVYACEDGEIIEKFCEEVGWPNCTHDGVLMHDNTFFSDKTEAVAYGKRNAKARISNSHSSVADAELRLAERLKWLHEAESNLARLEADYPLVAAEA